LLRFRGAGAEIDHFQFQALSKMIPEAQCLREVIARVEEDDIDDLGMRCRDVQQRQALSLERGACKNFFLTHEKFSIAPE
jgi:hypothetical protein